jgi:hypothetical protein
MACGARLRSGAVATTGKACYKRLVTRFQEGPA